MRPSDPRIRQRINQISNNFESANETAQEGIYALGQNYVSPCFAALGNCISACTAPCFTSGTNQSRRRRRGRAEANFDFYDDWDNDIADNGLLGWGTDELDHLLAGNGRGSGRGGGSGSGPDQPRRQRQMSYGTRHVRRRSTVLGSDGHNDPTVIPSSSFLGFLERFPWRFGARGQKYQPSVADLQENPRGSRRLAAAHEDEPLMEEAGAETEAGGEGRLKRRVSGGGNARDRSGTQSSRETNTSLSSRGDLLPSDEEEDAVPLDDDITMALTRRGTGFDSNPDDVVLEGKGGPVRRSTSGTLSPATTSSVGSKPRTKKRSTTKSVRSSDTNTNTAIQEVHRPSSISDLREEEAEAERREESNIKQKRLAAQKLAAERGLQHESMVSISHPHHFYINIKAFE